MKKPHIQSCFSLRKAFNYSILSGFLGLTLIGCTSPAHSNGAIAEFGYTKVKHHNHNKNGISSIRLKAIKDTAMSLGAQGGLAWRSKQINHMLEAQSSHLDQIFNFNALLINHNLLPPILVQSNNNYQQNSDTFIRLNQKSYKILHPAKFVTVPPTWRDYLSMDYPKPAQPDDSLLPQNNNEVAIWNKSLSKGWQQGIAQANEIFQENTNRMKRDFTGIILYRKLLAKHMVSAPFISSSSFGVTGDKNQISINDRVMRITQGSALNTNASSWKSIVTKDD